VTAKGIQERLSGLGLRIETDGGVLHLIGRRSAISPDLLEEVREHCEELIDALTSPLWPPESLKAELRFGHRHARLYPFLGRTIATPAGPGRLVQVFAERAGVVLECAPRQVCYFLPGELRPLGAPALAAPDLGCEVH
jgi:hypothetical protein